MTGDLRDRLDDLLAAVPDHVRVDAAAAWRSGAQHRLRRRLAVVGAGSVVLALVASAGVAAHRSTRATPADHRHPSGSGSFPTRIDAPVSSTPILGARSAPLAGLLQRGEHEWDAVTRTGHLLRLHTATDGAFPPSLSPDGTKVAFLRTANRGTRDWYVNDQAHASGVQWNIGAPGSGKDSVILPHTQTFWSPDSARLLVPVRPERDSSGRIVVARLLRGVHNSPVVRPAPGAMPVGWLSPTEIGWVGSRRTHGGRPPLLLFATSLHGGAPLRTVRLRADTLGGTTTATLSPDGHALSLTSTTYQYEFGPTGLLVGQEVLPAGAVLGCPVSWDSSQPWVPTGAGAPDDAVLVSQGSSVLIQADPRLRAGCSVWAASALDGSAHRGLGGWLFGTSDSWLSWHWRQVALGSVVSLGALLAAGWLVVRRRRRGWSSAANPA